MTSAIPAPSRRLLTRAVVPATLVALASLALLWTAWRTLMPAPTVEVVPVSARAVAGAAAGQAADPNDPQQLQQPPAQQHEGPPVQAPGWIEPLPFPVKVPALTPGIVRSVEVLEGDRVEAGQVLVELVDDEQRIALRLAEASLAQAKAKLAEMQDELARKSTLVSTGAASEGEVARLRLRTDAMAAEVQAAAAEVAMRALVVDRTRVRAPSAGIVMVRNAVPGMAAGSMQDGQALIELYDPAQLQVRADMPNADAGMVAVGDRAEITLDIAPGRTFAGEVVRIVHQSDIAKNTVQAKVRIIDPALALKPEMLARVRIFPRVTGAAGTAAQTAGGGASRKTTLWVPQQCVVGSPDASTVLVVVNLSDGVGIIEKRSIDAGPPVDGWREARTGLRDGDLVVRDPQQAPTPGTRVRIAEGWRNAPEGGSHVGH